MHTYIHIYTHTYIHICNYILYLKIAFDYEEGDVSAFLADMGWIVSHTYMTYGVLSSGGTTLLYNGDLEDHDLSMYSSVNS